MNDTYWNNKGKYQVIGQELGQLIPDEGSVDSNCPALEKLRVARNCYYDLFNNGLRNRAEEFREVFGFDGTTIVKTGFPYHEGLERKMDEIIVMAFAESLLNGKLTLREVICHTP